MAACVSTPVSTIFATATSLSVLTQTLPITSILAATVRTSTPATSTTVPLATSSTAGFSTLTRTTTIGGGTSSTSSSSSSSSSSGATALTSVNRSSSTPVGAIAGGVVGGIAVLFIGAVLLWYFSTKSSRKERERDFDFGGDDAWDPAAGIASGAAINKHISRRNVRGGAGGSGGYGNIRGEGEAMGMGEFERDQRTSAGKRKTKAAMEQESYYANAPPPPPHDDDYVVGGLAGVGAARGQRHNDDEAPYGGLDEGQQGGDMDGGWAVANQLHEQNRQGSQRNIPTLGSLAAASQQQQQQQDHRGLTPSASY
ncbi:hypothetical protein P7C70_g8766, partial [Phenoliferia sp. Uapishka_3]